MAFWGDNFRRGVFNLRVVSPSGATRVLSLDKPSLKIGRARDNDLVLDDPCIAEHHCRLLVRGGALELRDHGSRFGTSVNHRRCNEPTRIAEGDRVGVGGYLLELMPARLQADIDDVARRVRHAHEAWNQDPDEALRRQLGQAAGSWHALDRPRRLLPDDPRLVRAVDLDTRAPLAPLTRSWLAAAAARRRRRQGLRWGLGGACLGLALATQIVRDLPAADPPPAPASPAAPRVDVGPAAPLAIHAHQVLPGETLEQVARVYGVTPRAIEQWNHLAPGAALSVGTTLHVEATRGPLARSQILHEVAPGDTWETLAHQYGVDPARLRADHPLLGDTLRAGERLSFWAPVDRPPRPTYTPAAVEIPADARSTGRANDDGGLVDAVQIPPSRDYELRCPFNAYAASYTADRLLAGIAALRVHYRGQIVLGDLSREDGGSFGRHASHQSGRDVDIWLPRRGGYYRTAEECESCNTRWCRPEPGEVDWPATWSLVTALHATGGVQDVFLDRSLHPDLRAAAGAAGLSDDEVLRAIPVRAAADALVTHSDNHTHHIHVRFRCGPGDPGCRK